MRLQASNTFATGVAVIALLRYYQISAVFQRLSYHLDLGLPLEDKIAFTQVFRQPFMWIEIVVVSLHVPPFVSFEVCA